MVSLSNPLFTIGYSTHTQESLLHVLNKYKITALADVRSEPFSKYKPEFNRDVLSAFLNKNGVHYVFLGDECGARFKAQECYINGKADYRLIAKHPIFIHGLERIKRGLLTETIALMCAEKDPVQCHRMILICRNLCNENIEISHILHDGSFENHKNTELRLLQLFHLDLPDMFRDDNSKLTEAYDQQSDNIAYTGKSATGNIEEEVSDTHDNPFYDRLHKEIRA
jgi:uncharacterized protein (DUF488 family)